MAIPNCRDKLD